MAKIRKAETYYLIFLPVNYSNVSEIYKINILKNINAMILYQYAIPRFAHIYG